MVLRSGHLCFTLTKKEGTTVFIAELEWVILTSPASPLCTCAGSNNCFIQVL